MNSLYANIINESQKIFLKRKNVVLLILSAIITIGTAFIVSTVHKGLGIYAIRPVDFPIYILGFFTRVLLPLFIFMWASDIFAGEIAERNLKIVLVRPITRFKVFISKNVAIGCALIITLAIVFIFSSISSIFLGAAGKEFFKGLAYAAEAYIVAIIPMISLAAAVSFVVQFFKNSSGALTTSIILYIVLMLLPVVFPQASTILLTSYTNWHVLWLGSTVSITKLIYAFLIMLSNCLIFFAAGFYLFDARDL
jgi:ABC-2 type transport system permease protein